MARNTRGTRQHQTFSVSWLAAAVFLSLSTSAHAVDGVIEISQAKALVGGVTSGDTAGFPVTISAPGSYVLTSNLVVSAANVDAIVVSAASTEIDLNGFTIQGPVSCSGRGASLACSPSVSAGVAINSPVDHVSIKGGILQGFFLGVFGGNDCLFQDVIARSNYDAGFVVGARCRFVHNIASRNGGNGIDTDEGCEARENIAFANKGAGIRFRAPGGVAIGNIARSNGSLGLRAGAGAVVSGNSVSFNGGDGIQTVSGSTVVGNLSFNNLGYQISAGANAGFTNNVVSETGGLAAVSGGVYLAPNTCNGQQTEAACR